MDSYHQQGFHRNHQHNLRYNYHQSSMTTGWHDVQKHLLQKE